MSETCKDCKVDLFPHEVMYGQCEDCDMLHTDILTCSTCASDIELCKCKEK